MKLYRIHLLGLDSLFMNDMVVFGEQAIHNLKNIELTPSVPRNRLDLYGYKEDNITKRICFSDRLEGCFTSLGEGILDTYTNNMYNFFSKHNIAEYREYDDSVYFILFEIESEDYNCIHWEELYQENKVIDAEITHEWWILDTLEVRGKICKLKWYNETAEDIIPNEYNIDTDGLEEENEELYNEIQDFLENGVTTITNFFNLTIDYDVDLYKEFEWLISEYVDNYINNSSEDTLSFETEN